MSSSTVARTFDAALRFEDLSQHERDMAANAPDWASGVVQAIGFLHGDRVSTFMAEQAGDEVAVLAFAGDDTCFMNQFEAPVRRWPNRRCLPDGHRGVDDTTGPLVAADLESRDIAVGYAIERLFRAPWSLSEILCEAAFPTVEQRVFLAPLVSAWWAERMNAGVTVAVARTVLGLSVLPETLGWLDFSSCKAGRAPTVQTG